MDEPGPPIWLPPYVQEWSARNRMVLDLVIGEFLKGCEWPQRAPLQRSLARDISPPPDLSAISSEIPPPLGFVAPPDDRIVLTLFGIERTELGRFIVEGFVRALRRAVAIYRTADEEPILRWEDLANDTHLTVKLWRAVSEVLLREAPFLGGGTGGHHDDWQRDISEGVVRYWDVETSEEYLAVRAKELSASPQFSRSPARALPSPPLESGTILGSGPPVHVDSGGRHRSSQPAQVPTGIVIGAWAAMFASGVLSFALDAPASLSAAVLATAIATGVGWRRGFAWPPRPRTVLIVVLAAGVAAGVVGLATSADAVESTRERSIDHPSSPAR
jgi:hypothetical protein